MEPQHGASTWSLDMEPRHGASTWSLDLEPRHGASTWSLDDSSEINSCKMENKWKCDSVAQQVNILAKNIKIFPVPNKKVWIFRPYFVVRKTGKIWNVTIGAQSAEYFLQYFSNFLQMNFYSTVLFWPKYTLVLFDLPSGPMYSARLVSQSVRLYFPS